MSSHKSKSTKPAVMNTRKYNEAISGDTMSNYAMYKKGGSTKGFPDLNKDGKITKADILKGRGVIKKKGGIVKGASKTMKKGGMMKKNTTKKGM